MVNSPPAGRDQMLTLASRSSTDRRIARRYPYPAHIMIGERTARGCDISPTGLGATLPEPLHVGDTVTVTLGWAAGASQIASPARVVRTYACGDGFLIGLQFVSDEVRTELSPTPVSDPCPTCGRK